MILIGDSHAEGLGPHLQIAGLYYQRGVSTRGLVLAWPGLPSGTADTVLVSLGTNDAPGSVADAMGAAVELFRSEAPAARIVWIGPPDVTRDDIAARVREVAERQSARAAELGIQWIDSSPLTQAGRAGDGVHYTAAGYQAWALELTKRVQSPASEPAGELGALGLFLVLGVVLGLSGRA